MDADTIRKKNLETQAKIDKRDRERMKLRPLDKHYGQRYFFYDRGEEQRCIICPAKATILVNGTGFCTEHIKGSLHASN